MNIHVLKITPENFEANLSGLKRNETRINDRNYKSGDVLVLREYGQMPFPNLAFDFTDRVAIYRVTHVTYTKELPKPRDKAVMDIDWAVMSIEPWDENCAVKPQFGFAGTLQAIKHKTANLGPGCV